MSADPGDVINVVLPGVGQGCSAGSSAPTCSPDGAAYILGHGHGAVAHRQKASVETNTSPPTKHTECTGREEQLQVCADGRDSTQPAWMLFMSPFIASRSAWDACRNPL